MPFKKNIQSIVTSDWAVGTFLLIIFLLNNGYIYGWDDQHLEIPMLKGLIDQSLFQGDYYVESLIKNFPSYFYRGLAAVITIDQIPTVYLTLYLLSRYFLFFWIYRLWLTISNSRFSAFICSLTLIVLGRVEEFLYRTFSHQEFALAIIMAGLYLFYRKRYVLAAMVLGIAANIHAIYSVFVMAYMGLYLLLTIKDNGWKTLLKTCGGFLLFFSPLIYLIVKKYTGTHLPGDSPLLSGWIDLFLIACPQNFIFNDTPLSAMAQDFSVLLKASERYLVIISLYALNIFFNKDFRKDLKTQSVAITTFLLLAISFVFTYIFPSRFVIDLNLIRNIQYLQFFLIGYTTLLIIKTVHQEKALIGFLAAACFALLRFGDLTAAVSACFLFFLYLLLYGLRKGVTVQKYLFSSSAILMLSASAYILYVIFLTSTNYGRSSRITLSVTIVLLFVLTLWQWLLKNHRALSVIKKTIVIIPIFTVFVSYCYFHKRYVEVSKHGDGFWQMQRAWIDMQKFVKENTPVNALLLVPHDTEMGGFRIHSEREIVVSYRDCGIIGFDYAAAVEWKNRKDEVDAFQVLINKPITNAIQTAILKYRVNYIVFLNYAKPPAEAVMLEETYTNDVFSLFRVKTNPVPL